MDFHPRLKRLADMGAKSMRTVALVLIHIYRAHISSLLIGSCRFYPSCSAYAQEAFHELPLNEAFKKVFFRICRCHPLGSQKLYDPLRKEA